jgi:hypothetical protein
MTVIKMSFDGSLAALNDWKLAAVPGTGAGCFQRGIRCALFAWGCDPGTCIRRGVDGKTSYILWMDTRKTRLFTINKGP